MMDIHQIIYSGSLCSSGSGTNWLLAFSFCSRVCGTERRQGRNVRREERDWEIKKRNLLPKSPQSYQPYVVCLERWIPFHPKPWKKNLHPPMPFSLFFFSFSIPSPHQTKFHFSLFVTGPSFSTCLTQFTFQCISLLSFLSHSLCGFSSCLVTCPAPFISQWTKQFCSTARWDFLAPQCL